jgi:hypothetical protein
LGFRRDGEALSPRLDPTFPPPQVAVFDRTRHRWFTLPKDLPTFQADALPDEIAVVLTKR